VATNHPDRVQETTTTTGTGTLNLGGAVTGYRTFVAAGLDGLKVYYCIATSGSSEWEVGIGTVTDAATDTLSRTTVLASSNSNALVSLSAGTKNVFAVTPDALAKRLTTMAGVNMPPLVPNAEDEDFFSGTDGFSWANQGSATVVYANSTVALSAPANGTNSLRVRVKSITSPSSDYLYRTQFGLIGNLPLNFLNGGLVLKETSSGKLLSFALYSCDGSASHSTTLQVDRWNSETSYASTVSSTLVLGDTAYALALGPLIIEIERISTSLKFRLVSSLGSGTFEVCSETVNNFFSSQPDQWGIFANTANPSSASTMVCKWARRIS
jgi:hypothetical protein